MGGTPNFLKVISGNTVTSLQSVHKSWRRNFQRPAYLEATKMQLTIVLTILVHVVLELRTNFDQKR